MTSLIIPTHNQPDKLRQCLESIRKYTPDCQTLVILNDADEKSEAAAAALADRVIKIPGAIPAKRSLYDLWNRGVRHVRSKYVGIINDDIVVTPGWLGELTATLDSNPCVWCVSPRYTAEELPAAFPARVEKNLYPPRPLGFCFVVRRNVFRNPTVGWFDTAYRIWGGDSEFFLKLRLAGHPTVVVNRSYIHHWGSSTLETVSNLNHKLSPDTKLYGERWEGHISPYSP